MQKENDRLRNERAEKPNGVAIDAAAIEKQMQETFHAKELVLVQQHAVELERLKNEINIEQQQNYKAQIEELQKSLNSSNSTIKSLNEKMTATESHNSKLEADLQQVQSQLENMKVRNDKNMQESTQGFVF